MKDLSTWAKTALAVITGVAAAAAALVTLAGLIGKEPPTPPARQTTVAAVKLVDATRMTRGTWAERDPGEDVSAWDKRFRDTPGVLIEFDASFKGLTGRKLAIRALVLDRAQRRVGFSDANWVQPDAGEDTFPGSVWLELPRRRGPFTAQVVIYRDEQARSPWARSERVEFS